MGKGRRLKKNRDDRGRIRGDATNNLNLDAQPFAPGSRGDIMLAATLEFQEFLKKYGSTAPDIAEAKTRDATEEQETAQPRADEGGLHRAGGSGSGDGNGWDPAVDVDESPARTGAATRSGTAAGVREPQAPDTAPAGPIKGLREPDVAADGDQAARRDAEEQATPALPDASVRAQDAEKSDTGDSQSVSSVEEDNAPILLGQIFYRSTGPDAPLQPGREAEQTLNAIALFCAKRAETGLYVEKAGAGDWGTAFSGMRLIDLATEVGQPVELVAYFLTRQGFKSMLSGEGDETVVTNHATCGHVLTFFADADNVQMLVRTMDEEERQEQCDEEVGANALGQGVIPEDARPIAHVADSADQEGAIAVSGDSRGAELPKIAAPLDAPESPAPADRTDAPARPKERALEPSGEALVGSNRESRPLVKAAMRAVSA